jgi:hypothetical protein
MRGIRGNEILLGAAIATAIWAFLFVLQADPAAYSEICETSQSGQKDCATYHVIFVALWHIGKALDRFGSAITALATIAIAGFTFTLWRSTDRLWRAGEDQIAIARESSEIAERTLVAGQRPWIHVDIDIDDDMVFDGNGNARIPLVFVLKNIGHSPATNVRVNAYIFLFGPNHDNPLVEHRAYCEIVRRRTDRMLSYTLFPDEEPKRIPYFQTIGAHQFEELRESWRGRGADEWRHFIPHIVGCVSYSIPFDNRQHQTGFMTELRRLLPGAPPDLHWGMFSIEEQTVPATDMRLFHSAFGSPHID